jgi:hypothetical protein
LVVGVLILAARTRVRDAWVVIVLPVAVVGHDAGCSQWVVWSRSRPEL